MPYTIVIHYEGTPPPQDEFAIDADGKLVVTTIQDIKLEERQRCIRVIQRVCEWLHRNGGVKLEVIEVP